MKHNRQTWACVTLMMTLLVMMTSSQLEDLIDLCPAICAEPDLYSHLLPSSYRHCHCAQSMSRTAKPPSTTTDVCDYLCSIQLGGQACECSRPSLPGRK